MASPAALLWSFDRSELSRYPLNLEAGQRKLGPPNDWTGPPPARGAEIFVGHLPRDVMEQQLVRLFSFAGNIYQIRLMMEHSDTNRGYAFITYSTAEEAQRAVDYFNEYEIRVGHKIGVVISKDDRALCLRRIPLSTSRDEMLSIMSKLTPGVVNIIMQDSSWSGQRAIVEYGQHQTAAKARRFLLTHKLIINGSIASVEWFDPEADSVTAAITSTTNLFVTNFNSNVSAAHLRDLFSLSNVLSIKLIKFSKCRQYAFIHYYTEEQAKMVYNWALQDKFFGSLYCKQGKRLYVSWAKASKDRLADAHFTSASITADLF